MIPAKRAHLYVDASTHPGMKGKNNEDRYAVAAFTVDPEKRIPSLLAIISDGIGGHRAGEVAAEIAVETISRTIANSDASQPLATLQEAVAVASQAVRARAEKDPEYKGMGATCACAWVIGERLYIASVGDSRIYLIRGESIYKLTTDHTWIQEALEQGVLTPEQARGHPNAHVIRRYLGSQQPAEADLRLKLTREENDFQAQANQGIRIIPDDILLLCSDGLTDLVEDAEIYSALRRKDLDGALKDLTNLANERGGHDNITIVALKVPKVGVIPAARPMLQQPQRSSATVFFVSMGITVLILGLGALSLLGYYLLRPDSSATPTVTRIHTSTPLLTVSTTMTATNAGTLPSPSPALETSQAPSIGITITNQKGPFLPFPTRAGTLTPWPTATGVIPSNTPAPVSPPSSNLPSVLGLMKTLPPMMP